MNAESELDYRYMVEPLIMPFHPYGSGLAQDLFDALWLEDLYGFRSHCSMRSIADDKAMLEVRLDSIRSLRWQGHLADGLRPFRILAPDAALRTGTEEVGLEFGDAVEILQTADWWNDGTDRFASLFHLAYDQATFTAAHERNIVARLLAVPRDLLSWEALSCLKDRPFHPLARAKDWNEAPGHAYAAETMALLPLRWVAVPRNRIVTASGNRSTGQPLVENLLDPAQQDILANAAHACHADDEAWLWMPVHPWQWSWLKRSSPAKLNGCIELCTGPGTAIPTASLRSLVIPGKPDTHLKVALSVRTLGAVRTLPLRYLHNGVLASACLETLRKRDAWLGANLLLCQENEWWALSQSLQRHQPGQYDTLVSEPGELACMLRRYPPLPGATLIPMAALPATTADGALPAFDHLVGTIKQEEDAWRLFRDIARALLELGLRCFAHGVMPELHGQNVLLAFKDRRIAALVLRDHDTLRVCQGMLEQRGIKAPDYVIDRSTPNTLELDTPWELLAYLQTLAIEVNLYAIIVALASHYSRDEAQGWHIVRQVLEICLASIPLPPEIASQTKNLLLNEAEWPFKQVLAPLLGAESFGTGMPSAMGRVKNPLLTGNLPSYGGGSRDISYA
ncbi:MAG TPA: IucA/IucC family protein [Nitrosospira sp.]|nr:IucA/IucC family protein [Nitrosospira sp.]